MLKKIGSKTYIIDAYNKVGIYLINDKEVLIIDTGINDKSGKLILDICKKNKWNIKLIINTHSHIDHIGGNNMIHKQLNVPIYASGMERNFIDEPELSTNIVYGGYPPLFLRNKNLLAKKSVSSSINDLILPKGIDIINLPGHNADMIGVKTSDNIYFIGDALAGKDALKKYNIQFTYNPKKYFETLDYLLTLKGDLFVPSHGQCFKNIKEIVDLNKKSAQSVINNIKKNCLKAKSYENLFKNFLNIYNINVDIIQYYIIGMTVKCYLSYMVDEKTLKCFVKNNVMLWETK